MDRLIFNDGVVCLALPRVYSQVWYKDGLSTPGQEQLSEIQVLRCAPDRTFCHTRHNLRA
jgi:hypothetical protein